MGLFALLGFVYVPLGQHTGFEHARAVLSTPAASAAIQDLTGTALRLRQRAVDFVTGRVSPPEPVAEGPAPDAGREKRPGAREPRPVLPKLK